MAVMRFGYSLPNNMGIDDPDEVAELAVDCERLGFDSVWVAHHVFNIGYVRDRLGERPYHDALTILPGQRQRPAGSSWEPACSCCPICTRRFSPSS